MKNRNILVVEDERDIRELITYNLHKEGSRVVCVASGEEALEVFPGLKPDLVVLDIKLPGMDGLDVCRLLRAKPASPRIMLVSARNEETDVIMGLEMGADDYMTKPFSPRILVARIKALLRPPPKPTLKAEDGLEIGPIIINPGRHECLIDGKPISLTKTQFKILYLLAETPGAVYDRAQIMKRLRGEDAPEGARSVDTAIVGLRRKMGDHGHYVETLRGVGYRLRRMARPASTRAGNL